MNNLKRNKKRCLTQLHNTPIINTDAWLHNNPIYLQEVRLMARINLSIDDDLFDLLKDDADKHNCTVNVYLVTMLEKMYKQ